MIVKERVESHAKWANVTWKKCHLKKKHFLVNNSEGIWEECLGKTSHAIWLGYQLDARGIVFRFSPEAKISFLSKTSTLALACTCYPVQLVPQEFSLGLKRQGHKMKCSHPLRVEFQTAWAIFSIFHMTSYQCSGQNLHLFFLKFFHLFTVPNSNYGLIIYFCATGPPNPPAFKHKLRRLQCSYICNF
jgi:hypothetical protein